MFSSPQKIFTALATPPAAVTLDWQWTLVLLSLLTYPRMRRSQDRNPPSIHTGFFAPNTFLLQSNPPARQYAWPMP